jgi:hypothetical protein
LPAQLHAVVAVLAEFRERVPLHQYASAADVAVAAAAAAAEKTKMRMTTARMHILG